MQALHGLKTFGNVCPFLKKTTVSGLRSLSSPATGNRLAVLAQTQCPLMSMAYASKGFSTSAASFNTQVRGYASIAEQQADAAKLQREEAAAAASKTGQTAGVAAEAEQQTEKAHGGRPTAALGFAKHETTSARPGFSYESFYQSELEKKHKDKSYRVRLPISFATEAADHRASLVVSSVFQQHQSSRGEVPRCPYCPQGR